MMINLIILEMQNLACPYIEYATHKNEEILENLIFVCLSRSCGCLSRSWRLSLKVIGSLASSHLCSPFHDRFKELYKPEVCVSVVQSP